MAVVRRSNPKLLSEEADEPQNLGIYTFFTRTSGNQAHFANCPWSAQSFARAVRRSLRTCLLIEYIKAYLRKKQLQA